VDEAVSLLGARAPNVQGTAADKSLPPEARAMLDLITANEASPAGNYNSGDMDPNSFGGRYQDLMSTWKAWAKAGGFDPRDSSPINQDRVNWFGAQKDFRAATGKDLMTEIKAGHIEEITRVLGGTWHGLNRSSGAQWQTLFGRKLREEAAAIAGAAVPKLPAGLGVDAPHRSEFSGKSDPINPSFIPAWESGKYREGVFASKHQSMNDMSHFQGVNRQQTIRIDNQAGANYAVSGGMLGSGHGNFG
jgi:hypothetical protein